MQETNFQLSNLRERMMIRGANLEEHKIIACINRATVIFVALGVRYTVKSAKLLVQWEPCYSLQHLTVCFVSMIKFANI